MPHLIETDNLTFTYPHRAEGDLPALRGVSLSIGAGEYAAIVGRNGSGKTTLARHFNALLLPASGSVRVDGTDTRDPTARGRVRSTVGMVFQYPEDQIVATTVEEDVAFGLENRGVPSGEIRARVEDALRQVGMWEQRARPPYLLSAGQMQRVALAGVLAVRPRVIVFDEVTAMLDPAGRRAALAILDELHRDGLAVITITHSMAEAALAQRVIVMHMGQVAMDGTPEEVFADEDRLAALGLELPPAARMGKILRGRIRDLPGSLLTDRALLDALAELPEAGTADVSTTAPSGTVEGEPLIAVEGLGHIYRRGTPLAHRALEHVDLQIAAGSAHGLIGATGSGKSTVLQHLNGLLLPQEGRVRVAGHNLNDPKVDLRAVRRAAGLVMQLPETQFFEQYVLDEIAYGPRTLGREATLREDVLSAMAAVGLDYETFKDRQSFTLSGGERRKVALASILAVRPRILLLDEPFLGLDPAAHRELLQTFRGMVADGLTVALSSHDMDDLAALAGTLTVMSGGSSAASGATGAIFAQEVLLRESGLEPPLAARAANLLRAKGWSLPPEVLLIDDLTRALAAGGAA